MPQITPNNTNDNAPAAPSSNSVPTTPSLSPLVLIAAVLVAALALGVVGFFLYKVSNPSAATSSDDVASDPLADVSDANVEANTPENEVAANNSVSVAPTVAPTTVEATTTITSSVSPASSVLAPEAQAPLETRESAPRQAKLYKEMTEEEKNEFVKRRAQHIAVMMGRRPYAFTPDALKHIRFWLDSFAKRAGNGRTGMWGGDTLATLERGRTHAPTIIRAFREYNVPIVVGLYIPFIETEYTNVSTSNSAGAAGLFQFLGSTAEGYGVPASERTDIPKMSVAAARYFRDNIMSFGSDPMSVALSIAGYNRAAESVKRDLRNVLNMPNNEDKERSFWTLIANQGVLDEKFQKENVNYVPRFFAAAIFGETPWAFGAKTRPLSTYTTPEADASVAASTQPTPAPRR